MRAATSIALLALLGRAPLQCGSRPPPEVAREENPAEELYRLAERFETQGNTAARDETLRYIVERYPTSRYSHRARETLGMLDGGG